MCTPMSISGPPPDGRPLGEPAAQAGDALAAQPAGLRVVDGPEHAVVDDLLQRLDLTATPVVERDVEHPVVPLGRVDHPLGRRRVLGDRLLRQHVQPGVQRGDGDRGVQRGRGGDADHVELTMINKVLPVVVAMFRRDPVLITQLLQGSCLHAGQRDKINIGGGGVRGHVLPSGPAEADHPGPELSAAHRAAPTS